MSSSAGLPTRPLGRTGEHVSMLGLGGWHIRNVKDDAEAFRIMYTAIDEGLTFFDNSWDYHDGAAEELMGRALKEAGRRQQVFLMTKNCERDYAGSMRHLEDSLRRLQTDVIDLWQFHEINYDNDPDWLMEQGGLRAALQARQEGKVRYIGFTGHKDPIIHRKMLRLDFQWDTSQMPNNVLDEQYRSFRHEVMPLCAEMGVGVIGMKGLGGGADQGLILEKMDLTVEELLRYCWSQPIATQVTGIQSMAQLQQDLAAARAFLPLTAEEAAQLTARVKHVAGDGRFETFKSTKDHDGPRHRRQHGFAA